MVFILRSNISLYIPRTEENATKDGRNADRLASDWFGAYTIQDISPKGTCILTDVSGVVLKTNVNAGLLKSYLLRSSQDVLTNTADGSDVILILEDNNKSGDGSAGDNELCQCLPQPDVCVLSSDYTSTPQTGNQCQTDARHVTSAVNGH